MSHTEADLPAVIHEAEFVILADGTQVRYEEAAAREATFSSMTNGPPAPHCFPVRTTVLKQGAAPTC